MRKENAEGKCGEARSFFTCDAFAACRPSARSPLRFGNFMPHAVPPPRAILTYAFPGQLRDN